MNKVIFVCTGNTCRSPMAEGLAKQIWPRAQIMSRGLSVYHGDKANDKSVACMKNYGIDLSTHKPKSFNPKEVDSETVVLTMTAQHKSYIEAVAPQLKGQVHTILGYAGLIGDVVDPYGGSLAIYETCADLIKETLEIIKNNELDVP